MADKKEEKKETQNEPSEEEEKVREKEAREKEETNAILERAEKVNEEKKALLDREERLMAEKAVSGQADGSVPKKEKTEDEKWAEDAKKRYDGTGMDPTE